MPMIRRGDNNRVDIFSLKHVPVITIGVAFAAHQGGSSFRMELEDGTIEQTATGLILKRPGSKEAEVLALDAVPEATDVLLDGFRDYVEKDQEPEFSGPSNLTTVAMVEAMAVASDEGRTVAFEDFIGKATG